MNTIKHLHAKEKAEALIEKYGLGTPVQVFELADLMGISWKVCDVKMLTKLVTEREPNIQEQMDINRWEDVLGYYDKKINTFLLNNETQPITRKRFTMAHEIGHHQLHNHLEHSQFRTIFLRQDIVQQEDTIEAEANYFAGYLLMPDNAIIKRLEYTDVLSGSVAIIEMFSKMFAVSPEAMRIRFRTFKNEHPDIWGKHNMDLKLS